MIKVKNVSKIYTHGASTTYALDDVSLILPEKGMIFVVGKSGSGKSTLLNILAGFDKPTKGEVEVAGQKLDEMEQVQLDYYRNQTIGFVFQDYCLIETLTVYQNIRMVHDFQNQTIKKKEINETLNSVGMKGYGYRYPRQLSAGQKQRVAIARALSKNPKVILADEPTGNLDVKTTKQVLELLKEISKDRLVVVVSHNKEDARIYADRIVEIGSGKILSYKYKNNKYTNEYTSDLNQITLPSKGRLTTEQITDINTKIKSTKGKIKINKCKEEFLPITRVVRSRQKLKTNKINMGLKNMLKYAWLFFKNQLASFFLVVFIVTFLITVLSISIQFGWYDGKYQYQESINKANHDVIFVKQEGEDELGFEDISSNYFYEFDEEITQKIKQKFNCNPYKIYNYYLPVTTNTKKSYVWNTTNSFYSQGFISGVNNLVECDIEYLKELFGDEKGNLSYLGDISEDSDGIFITDYVADGMLYKNIHGKYKSYYDILYNEETSCILYDYYGIKVSAIINTNYRETYKEFFTNKNPSSLLSDEKYIDMADLLLYQYGVAYTTNPNYFEVYKNDVVSHSRYIDCKKIELISGPNSYLKEDGLMFAKGTYKIGDDEIFLPYNIYNELFGKNCTASNKSEFTEETITLNIYNVYSNVTISRDVKVTGLVSSSYIYVGDNIFKNQVDNQFYQVGLSLFHFEDFAEIMTHTSELNVYITNARMTVVDKAIEVVSVFNDLFTLLTVIMIISIFVLIMVNAINTINKNIYNIGVSRAMGAHMSELGFIYSVQMIIFGILVVSLSLICDYYSTAIINELIMTNITKIIEMPGVNEITFVVFNPEITSFCTTLVVILTIVSIFMPIISIRKMNPVNIIKSR